MKHYEDMSVFEINKLVAGHLHGEEWWHKYNTVLTMQLRPTDSGGMSMKKSPVDYCNNPSDAWPIIVDNKINIEWRDSLKLHPLAKGTGGNACHWSDKNPLRAAMIYFLKMKDTEK